MYKIIRPVLFLFDPEWIHTISMKCLEIFCRLPLGKKLLTAAFRPKRILPTTFLGIIFSNPVGLGAGFDKNARYLEELEALGFGFVEIGTVTPLAQPGNDKPRLFRLPKDKALINRMGFNNEGVEAVGKQLKSWKKKSAGKNGEAGGSGRERNTPGPASQKSRLIIGGNIGKNKLTANEDAWMDYVVCFNALHEYVDYFVVNVSSPNTPGLRELQEKESLRKILTQIQIQNMTFEIKRPILLKISPDLTTGQVDDVIDLALEIKLDGLVVCNTTISREHLESTKPLPDSIGAGGLSGLPLRHRSTEIIQYIHQKTKGQIPVIASGGIFTGADAEEKLSAGATLVQVWTGFVYEGPSIVKNICRYLSARQS